MSRVALFLETHQAVSTCSVFQALTDVAGPDPDFATALADDSSLALVKGQFPGTNMTYFTQVRFYDSFPAQS